MNQRIRFALWSFAMYLIASTVAAENRVFFYPPSWHAETTGSNRSAPDPTACMTSECPPLEIPRCGNPDAWTAVSRMPPVRIAVYDPISNSFGYIAPCASDPTLVARRRDAAAMEMADRYRLVLTTQKIRLLIMPYNPADGDLTLEVKPGQGVEFVLVPAASATAKGTSGDTTQIPKTSKKPEDVPPAPQANEETKTELKKNKNSAANRDPGVVQGEIAAVRERMDLSALVQHSFKAEWIDEFVRLDAAIKGYRDSALDIDSLLRSSVETPTDSLEDSVKSAIAAAMIKINSGCKTDKDGEQCYPFTLASDVRFDSVIAESERRTSIFSTAARTLAQHVDGNEKEVGSILNVRANFNSVSTKLAQNSVLLDAIDHLFVLTDVRAGTDTAWKGEKDDYKSTIKKLHDLQTSLDKRVADDAKALKDLRTHLTTDMAPITGASTQIQRFDYPPLHDGESVIFAVHRSTAADGVTRQPGHANIIELRSTPVDVFRFGMGVVYSGLRNPTFKPGPLVNKLDASGNPMRDTDNKIIQEKQIFFDDEGNGAPLIGAFIHNNWGRKSPFLTPTMQERFLPTVSVGLPVVAKADHPFDQVLFGLNWELISGVDFSVGKHFGKVNALQHGYSVGDKVPASTDILLLQKKATDSSWYFGVVLNSDIFKTLTGGRTQ